ncbi:MAG TPA: hypothetical protein VLL52_01990 [Anaerolineae bacterium]|nr:hypothetical protein [Anaerolineae bacterium]
MSEILGIVIGFLLTIAIFSYLWGDNRLYRFAAHILVGVSAGYAGVITLQNVIAPTMRQLIGIRDNPTAIIWLMPLFLGALLLLKIWPNAAPIGNSAVAAMVGIGAAVALTGAFNGTLWPQLTTFGTEPYIGWVGMATALLTICTLLSFQFIRRKDFRPHDVWGKRQKWVTSIGQGVIMITFGALFATALQTSLSLLTERILYIINNFSYIIEQITS